VAEGQRAAVWVAPCSSAREYVQDAWQQPPLGNSAAVCSPHQPHGRRWLGCCRQDVPCHALPSLPDGCHGQHRTRGVGVSVRTAGPGMQRLPPSRGGARVATAIMGCTLALWCWLPVLRNKVHGSFLQSALPAMPRRVATAAPCRRAQAPVAPHAHLVRLPLLAAERLGAAWLAPDAAAVHAASGILVLGTRHVLPVVAAVCCIIADHPCRGCSRQPGGLRGAELVDISTQDNGGSCRLNNRTTSSAGRHALFTPTSSRDTSPTTTACQNRSTGCGDKQGVVHAWQLGH
jgi:hypothetical protein